jgi:hypothetical protein
MMTLAQTTAPTSPSSGTIIAILIAILVVVALVAWALYRQRSRGMRERFGPEYDRIVEQTGSRARAERELAERKHRHDAYDIRPLTPGARARYADEWRAIQARFVDQPEDAVREADRLIVAVMRDRGYPVDDGSRRLDDLSVEHADVLDNYRTARRIAARNERHEAATEELRQATVSYRALFDDLLEAHR